MFKKKLKELRMGNNSLENDINKYQPIKKVNIINNQKLPDNFTRRNLPELKLSKLKSRFPLETDTDVKEDNNNSQIKIKQINNIRKPKSRSQLKNRDIIFPKIKNVFPNVSNFENSKNKNNFPIYNYNNIHNINNYNISHIQKTQPRPNTYNMNNPINIHKVRNTFPINSNPKTIQQKKLNKIKKESDLFHNHNLNPSNLNNQNSNLQNLQNLQNLTIQNSKPISNSNNIQSIIKQNQNPINPINTINPITSNSNSQNSNIQNSNIQNNNINNIEMQELDMMTEKLNMLHSLFNSLSTLSGNGPSYPFFKPKTVNVTPEILTQTFPNFEESKFSQISEFENSKFTKAYSYCTNKGNVRDYNEDTITVTKINNNNNLDSFYFYAIYDGHGGNGCSIFLRDNLHNFISNFSKESLIKAIEESENIFCKKYALDDKGEIKDPSGSCGIIALIKENKLLIANVGDSRLVIFKKSKCHFFTIDHKPGSESEKNRITNAGGRIYQTPSFIPLFQNGQEIEIPWRVLPGRLSVSRTFGDIEAKDEKFGGMKNVVCALPDITEIELNDDFSFIVIGCDGIFDVLSNEELVECVKIVLNEKNNLDVNLICKECSNMIIKSSLAKDSFDNVSCIFIALNLKKVLE